MEHVESACRGMSHHAGPNSTSGVCRDELALTFVLRDEDCTASKFVSPYDGLKLALNQFRGEKSAGGSWTCRAGRAGSCGSDSV